MKIKSVILLLGSNIEPERNIPAALDLLSQATVIEVKSHIWETEAVGSSGPNFLNIAVRIDTAFDVDKIKKEIINPIEQELKRVRTEDKYAPRTIDIDIIIFRNQVLDPNLWEKAFIALPVSELMPDLPHPLHEVSLAQIAGKLKSSVFAELFRP